MLYHVREVTLDGKTFWNLFGCWPIDLKSSEIGAVFINIITFDFSSESEISPWARSETYMISDYVVGAEKSHDGKEGPTAVS